MQPVVVELNEDLDNTTIATITTTTNKKQIKTEENVTKAKLCEGR